MFFLLIACPLPALMDGGAPPLPLAGCRGMMDFDVGGDGSSEGTWIFLYNALGEPDEATFDQGADGDIDSRMRYRYDDLGRLAYRDWDGDNDQTTDIRTAYRYDDQHRLSGISEDRQNDGTEDRIESYAYDAQNRLLHSRAWMGNDPAHITAESSYTYNGGGWASSILWVEPERSSSIIHRYPDSDGNLIREEIDLHLDGRIEQIELTVWEEGRKLRVDKDSNADGQVDYLSTWTYNCF